MAGFILPPQNHLAREAAPVEALVSLLDRRNLAALPHFADALRLARNDFPAGARRVFIVCLRADDERWLISVGPRGGWRKEWNYGTGA
jgi:hypothetical protein